MQRRRSRASEDTRRWRVTCGSGTVFQFWARTCARQLFSMQPVARPGVLASIRHVSRTATETLIARSTNVVSPHGEEMNAGCVDTFGHEAEKAWSINIQTILSITHTHVPEGHEHADRDVRSRGNRQTGHLLVPLYVHEVDDVEGGRLQLRQPVGDHVTALPHVEPEALQGTVEEHALSNDVDHEKVDGRDGTGGGGERQHVGSTVMKRLRGPAAYGEIGGAGMETTLFGIYVPNLRNHRTVCDRLFKRFRSQFHIARGCDNSDMCGDSDTCAEIELNNRWLVSSRFQFSFLVSQKRQQLEWNTDVERPPRRRSWRANNEQYTGKKLSNDADAPRLPPPFTAAVVQSTVVEPLPLQTELRDVYAV